MTIVTYQPTEAEINQIIAKGKAKHSAHTMLYDGAAAILHKGQIGYAFDAWHCLSQTDPTQVYRLEDGACNCPTHTQAQYKIMQRPYCAHSIAYYALLQILTQQFNTRWIGNFLDPQAVARYRDQPNTWLLQHYATPSFHAWNGTHGHFVCFAMSVPVKPTTNPDPDQPAKRFAPANPLQFAQFSNWLAQASHALI